MLVSKEMFKRVRKIIVISVLVSFMASSVQMPVFAQIDPLPFLPVPGTMVNLSPEYTPAYLKGIVIHPKEPLKFDFIIYKGDKPLSDSQKREEYTKLTKYFLASLAIPDDDQWVNLSPYEKDRIIKDNFGKTEMGRDLLAQDYMLKQITASLIYPENKLGKEFWSKVYAQARKLYGTSNIPVNTFNKVWILPDDALIYEKGNTAYVLKNHLRVMLEEDYLSLVKHEGQPGDMFPAKRGTCPQAGCEASIPLNVKASQGNPLRPNESIHTLGSQIIKQIVLPELQREVNEDKNFAPLRQVYSGMLLATWFKRTLKQSLLGQIYANKSKTKGLGYMPSSNHTHMSSTKQTHMSSPNALIGDPQYIYQQYIKAYKKGVFNFIKEDVDKLTNETVPRKYFSGGAVNFENADRAMGHGVIHEIKYANPAQIAQIEGDEFRDEVAGFAMKEAGKVDAAMTGKAPADGAMNVRVEDNIEKLGGPTAVLNEIERITLKAADHSPSYNIGENAIPWMRSVINDIQGRHSDFIDALALALNANTKKIIGYVFYRIPPRTYPPVIDVSFLAVHPDSQGQGAGTELMNWVFNHAVSHNIFEIILETDSEDNPALEFYKNLQIKIPGFEIKKHPSQSVSPKGTLRTQFIWTIMRRADEKTRPGRDAAVNAPRGLGTDEAMLEPINFINSSYDYRNEELIIHGRHLQPKSLTGTSEIFLDPERRIIYRVTRKGGVENIQEAHNFDRMHRRGIAPALRQYGFINPDGHVNTNSHYVVAVDYQDGDILDNVIKKRDFGNKRNVIVQGIIEILRKSVLGNDADNTPFGMVDFRPSNIFITQNPIPGMGIAMFHDVEMMSESYTVEDAAFGYRRNIEDSAYSSIWKIIDPEGRIVDFLNGIIKDRAMAHLPGRVARDVAMNNITLSVTDIRKINLMLEGDDYKMIRMIFNLKDANPNLFRVLEQGEQWIPKLSAFAHSNGPEGLRRIQRIAEISRIVGTWAVDPMRSGDPETKKVAEIIAESTGPFRDEQTRAVMGAVRKIEASNFSVDHREILFDILVGRTLAAYRFKDRFEGQKEIYNILLNGGYARFNGFRGSSTTYISKGDARYGKLYEMIKDGVFKNHVGSVFIDKRRIGRSVARYSQKIEVDRGRFKVYSAPPALIPLIIRHLDGLWVEMMKAPANSDELFKYIAQYEWWLFQANPFGRASAAIGDAMSLAVQVVKGMPLRNGFESTDFKALSMTLDQYIAFRTKEFREAANRAQMVHINKRPTGGIDLNSANLVLTIKRDGNGIPIISQQDLAQISSQMEGLDPVILSIKPASQTAVFADLIGPSLI